METLKVFCDVVRFRSFSKGAQENFLSQSAASQAVHHLEERLGVVMLDRAHRPFKLTHEGKFFYEGCREVLDRYLDLEAKVKSFHEEVNSNIRIACIYSVGLRHMSRYVEIFSKQHPHAHIHLEYLHPDRVYESVLNEEVDLGVVSFPKASRELSVIPWRVEPMVLALSPEHSLARMKEMDPGQLKGEKFVGFDKNLVIRKEVDRFLRRHKTEVNVVLEFDNIEAIKRAVEIASGVSILPRPTLDREVKTGTLVAIPFSGKELIRPLGIIHRRGKNFHVNIARFIDLLRSEGKVLLTDPDVFFERSRRAVS